MTKDINEQHPVDYSQYIDNLSPVKIYVIVNWLSLPSTVYSTAQK